MNCMTAIVCLWVGLCLSSVTARGYNTPNDRPNTKHILEDPSRLRDQSRSMAQDPTLDNLRLPPGTKTTPAGTLGQVRRFGEGPKVMLLIPGIGFSGNIWSEFMERHRTEYTMYAITLPGFGDTPPLAMPSEGSRFADTPWIKSTLQAIGALLDREHIERVTIVAHWALATQIALRLAVDDPNRVEAVVLIAGVLKVYYENSPGMLTWTPEQRSGFVESMAHHWFKTVTRQTWDDNNFMSYDYAVNPRRGLFLWREAQAPLLPVWIRYLLEFYSMDLSADLKDLRVSTLIVQPGFDDPAYYVEQGRNYMRNLCLDSWKGAAELNKLVEFVTIPQSRLFIMHDQPEALEKAMSPFLKRLGK
jgi:pimeloyl-ACP methyl ester carboxylesterase